MSLSSALSIAQSSIRNTAPADQHRFPQRPGSQQSRLHPPHGGPHQHAPGARSVEIQRAANEQLFRQNLSALSAFNGQSTLYNGMEQLGPLGQRRRNATSPATAIGKLQEALQLYSHVAVQPATSPRTRSTPRAQVVRTLNDGTTRDPGLPRRRRPGDRDRRRRAEPAARRFREGQQRRHIRHALRPRRLRRARPARRDAEEDRRICAGLDLHARRQRHGRADHSDGTTLFETVPRASASRRTAVYAAGTTGKPSISTACRSIRGRRQHQRVGQASPA